MTKLIRKILGRLFPLECPNCKTKSVVYVFEDKQKEDKPLTYSCKVCKEYFYEKIYYIL